MISKRRFYLTAFAIVTGSMAVGSALQFLLPFWLGLGVSIFVGFVFGNAAAQAYLSHLLPPDE